VNLAVYPRQAGTHGGSGYPMLRLVAVVACGTRTLIDAVFTPISVGELGCATRLLGCLQPGMLLLADRGFAARQMIEQFAATGADLLIRDKDDRRLPMIRRCSDGSWLSTIGAMTVRVIDAEIIVTLDGQRHVGRYRLLTTLTDHRAFPASDLVTLYHQRWEIETCYLELKSTTLGGRVLRARTPAGIAQEVYALLTTYQILHIAIAIADAIATTDGIDPDRGSFTIALNAARDLTIQATAVIADSVIDLVGDIGRLVLANLMPNRRIRTTPRLVKRAISKYNARGTIDRTSYKATTSIDILTLPSP
jgi:hypothetical protein